MSADLVIGIDLGGTNMRGAIYRGLRAAAEVAAHQPLGPEQEKALRPLAERREKVGSERAVERMVERMGALVDSLLAEAGVEGEVVPVGIGLAGMLRGTSGIVAQSPHLGWRNVSLGDMMRARLGDRHPVVVENDVNAITWGEFVMGAGRDVPDILAVYVGTGIGGGAVCDGRLLRGGTGCAVEIGHTKVVYDDSARPCACGLKGCVEAYAGGEPLQRRIRAELAGGARSAAVGIAGSPEAVHPGHVDAAAAEGDEYALNLWLEIGPLLGVALANAVTLFNPNRLILGGGVLSRTPVLKEHIIAAVEVAINPPAQEDLAIENAALGDDAGLVGSALLALTP
ncbi:MAG TPA: ROK family protein [Kofleriaceae bacterium]|nr:ROK family protein [Kofleriaceae bacterium]